MTEKDPNEYCPCGERYDNGFFIQGELILLCPVCDAEEEETHPEDDCSCRYDEINPYCRWCFV